MEIAFTTLLIALIILPGIIFRYTYRKGFWNCPVYLSTFSNELLYGIVFAVFINLILFLFIKLFSWTYDFEVLLAVLTGNIDDTNIITVSDNITQYFSHILSYFLLMDIFAFLLGLLLHSVVRGLKLDLKFKFFRFNNEWYYIFQGEQAFIDDMKAASFIEKFKIRIWRINFILKNMYTYVTAVIVIGERKFLYWGIVSNFFFNKKGDLERIVLIQAHRRDLEDDKEEPSECDPNEDNRFYKIDGEYLVLNYSDILTLNVDYRFLIPAMEEESKK